MLDQYDSFGGLRIFRKYTTLSIADGKEDDSSEKDDQGIKTHVGKIRRKKV